MTAEVAARAVDRVRGRIERAGYAAHYRATSLNYAVGVATPKRTVAGDYWSYELRNGHGDDPGLAALAALSADATVVDVGAHVGEYALPLSATGRTVHAFEPNPTAADRFERNARRSGLEPTLHRVGLGAERAERRFYRSTFSKLSAFDRDAATRWGAGVAAVERVPVRRLDDLVGTALPPPDGLKIDVEGAELAVLRGAARTVDRHEPLLVVEHHADAVDPADLSALRSWLLERGYSIGERGDAWVCERGTGAAVELEGCESETGRDPARVESIGTKTDSAGRERRP